MVSVKGGWGLLARFEASVVLGFGDKAPTPQEGDLGSGKLALSLIRLGGRKGMGGQNWGCWTCHLAPISCYLRCEYKQLA